MCELSPFDETGQKLATPRLSTLFGEGNVDRRGTEPVEATRGGGKVVFLGDDFALRLFEPVDPVRDPKVRVPLPPFNASRAGLLDRLIASALGRSGSLFVTPPEQDVEVTWLRGKRADLLLAINWDTKREARVRLRMPPGVTGGKAEGYTISAGAAVAPIGARVRPLGWPLRLAPQHAILMRIVQK